MLLLVETESLMATHIDRWINMYDGIKYQIGTHHAFLAGDLYDQVNPAKWGITKKFIEKHGSLYREDYCGRILTYFIYLVVLDIIENNITLEFPMTGAHSAKMYVKCYQDEEFERAMRHGAFQGQDFIATEFKAYRLCFQWYRYGRIREKPIYITANVRDWFYDKINKGKKYY